jgi:hypothetical protein
MHEYISAHRIEYFRVNLQICPEILKIWHECSNPNLSSPKAVSLTRKTTLQLQLPALTTATL